jgi:hypothetical protein
MPSVPGENSWHCTRLRFRPGLKREAHSACAARRPE